MYYISMDNHECHNATQISPLMWDVEYTQCGEKPSNRVEWLLKHVARTHDDDYSKTYTYIS